MPREQVAVIYYLSKEPIRNFSSWELIGWSTARGKSDILTRLILCMVSGRLSRLPSLTVWRGQRSNTRACWGKGCRRGLRCQRRGCARLLRRRVHFHRSLSRFQVGVRRDRRRSGSIWLAHSPFKKHVLMQIQIPRLSKTNHSTTRDVWEIHTCIRTRKCVISGNQKYLTGGLVHLTK